jgi:hypothetical protein
VRDILTVLAAALALALLVALAGPHLVDWERHRDAVSAELSRALGREVRLDGAITLELLPAPYMKLAAVSVADNGDGASARIDRLRLRMQVPPLLRGEVRIGEAVVHGPHLRLSRKAASQSSVSLLPPDWADRVAVERLRFEGGTLTVDGDAAESRLAEEIDGQVEIQSLRGPFRGSGSFVAGGQRRTVRLAASRVEAGESRVRLLVESDLAAARYEIDGRLFLASAEGPPGPRFEGAVSANGNLPVGEGALAGHLLWRAVGKAIVAGRQARLDSVEVALGESGRQIVLSGVADIDLTGRPKVDATLSTRQIDLDRILTREGDGAARSPTPQQLLRQLPTPGGDNGPLPIDMKLEVSAGSLLWGQDRVGAPRVRLSVVEGRLAVEDLSAELPGSASIAASGAPGDGEILFNGRIAFKAGDAERLARWYTGGLSRPLPFKEAELAGRLKVTAAETAVDEASMRLDDSRLAGTIALVDADARPGGRQKLILRVKSEKLDISRLPRLDAGDGDSDLDLDIDFSAAQVRYSDLGAGQIILKAQRSGERLTVPVLSIRNLGGADVEGAGILSGDSGTFRARLTATRLEALAALAQRLAPGGIADALVHRAGLLSPADVAITGSSDSLRGDAPRRFSVSGRMGGTDVDAEAVLQTAGSGVGSARLKLSVANAIAGNLLRQVGLEAQPLREAGPARLGLEAGLNEPAHAFTVKLDGQLAGLDISLSGSQPPGEGRPFAGALKLRAGDLSPLARTLLLTVPVVRPGTSLALDSGLRFENYRITLTDVAARAGDVPFRGEIASNLIEFGRVAGQLKTGVIDVAAYLPIVFGDGVPAGNDGAWSRQPFPAAAAPLLSGDLWIEPEALLVPGGYLVEQPKLVFRFDRGLMFIDHAEGKVGDGRVKAQATLRRAGPQVNLNARLTLTELPVSILPFASGLQGRISGPFEISSIGTSPSEVIAGLAGGGRPSVTDLILPRLDPMALARTLARPLPDTVAIDGGELRRLLESEASRAPLVTSSTALPVVLSGGVLRVGPLFAARGGRTVDATFAADLRSLSAEGRAQYVDRDPPKGWQGAPPQAALLWRGPLREPQRQADVDSLLTGLTAMALARDLERIEAFEHDQRERSFFLRRQRASDEERRRIEEERRQAALRAEQERREEAQRLDQERRRQEELRRLEVERQRLEAERLRREEEALQEEMIRRVRARLEEERRRREAEEALRQEAESRRREVEEALRRLPLPDLPDLPVILAE